MKIAQHLFSRNFGISIQPKFEGMLFFCSIFCIAVSGSSSCYVFPSDMKDPCIGKRCSYGAQCTPSLDGLTARCQCPEHCDTYGDNVGSQALCASDGNDYANTCEMRQAACREMKDLEKKYDGKCDPCNGHECSMDQICQLDDNRRPICRCDSHCLDEFLPVCGNDGKTYATECALKLESCRSHSEITVMFRGECSSGKNPCQDVKCKYGEKCNVDGFGKARCVCPLSCEPLLRPVCGSDGRTYDNVCLLHRQACLTKRSVNISYVGPCSSKSPCNMYKCSYGALCVVKNDQSSCQCPHCSEEFQPVCGSDGISYENECKLKLAICINQRTIVVHSSGLCNGCENMKCDYHAICESDGRRGARCVCPSSCIQVENKVCGSNRVTYMNECELKVASCRTQQFLLIMSHGACDECDRIKCKFGAVCENSKCQCPKHCSSAEEPVCASDGVSYLNECALRRSACQRGITLKILHEGECEELSSSGNICDETTCRFGGTCLDDMESFKGCVCKFYCNSIRAPLCGSDGRTYASECQMREESCRRQIEIFPLPLESCQDIDEELCDGKPPIVNPATKLEYNCDTARDVCPYGSYCHKVTSGAKCCKEDKPNRTCSDTKFGCCPDGRTPAPGAHHAGCPSICQCNPLGSYGRTCDPTTRQCTCKPGVGGLRCDRCEPNFWGLSKIAEGNSGCVPCACNMFGSIRDDCEQTTGRCVCKSHVTGQKCNICSNGKELGLHGCTGSSYAHNRKDPQPLPGSCSELECRYNAVCQLTNGLAECICPSSCQTMNTTSTVCGTDGVTYSSACHLRLTACRLQKDTMVAHYGPCLELLLLTRNSSRSMYYNRVTKDIFDSTQSGKIGDFCQSHQECLVEEGICGNGRCRCREGFTSSVDRRRCRQSGYLVPSFLGNSYLKLAKLEHGSRELSIEIMFRPLRSNGVLLYIGQNDDGKGDFISISLKDKYIYFRYDLGSGPVTLATVDKVVLNAQHRVLARRFGKDGLLQLDDTSEVSGVSPGLLRTLNLGTSFFIGSVANLTDQIVKNIGLSSGFVGCIESLKVDSSEKSHVYDLGRLSGSPDVDDEFAVVECSNFPCDSQPCLNGATCVHLDSVNYDCYCPEGFAGTYCQERALFSVNCIPNPCLDGGSCFGLAFGGFYCVCPPGRGGERCEEALNGHLESIVTPEFDGYSYLEVKLSKNVGRQFSYEVWFFSRRPDGVLLYSSQEGTDKGDFFSLNIVNRYLQLRYNLGSGLANITSSTAISLYTWNRAIVFRMNQFGSLSLNNGAPVKGHSGGDLKELNLPMSVYIGGYVGEYNSEAGITSGFHGAIQKFYEDGALVENLVAESVVRHRISHYNGPPCPFYHNPCLNHATCTANLNNFECQCPANNTGKICELSLDILDTNRPLAFNRLIYQNYRNTITRLERSQSTNKYELRLRTDAHEGLLLLQHKTDSVDSDYLAIAINDGHVEATFNLGKERPSDLLIMRSRISVTDRHWHKVTFLREKRLAYLYVDSGSPVTVLSSPGATQLDTDGYLWLGGCSNVPKGLPDAYHIGFLGCIDYLKINDRSVDLLANRISHNNVEFCDF